jgi:hypothetical protein
MKYWRIQVCNFPAAESDARLFLKVLQSDEDVPFIYRVWHPWTEQHVYLFPQPCTESEKNTIIAYVVTKDDYTSADICRYIRESQLEAGMLDSNDGLHVSEVCGEHYNEWKQRYNEVLKGT